MAAVSTESRLSAIEAALGLPDGGSEGGAAPAEVKEVRKHEFPLSNARMHAAFVAHTVVWPGNGCGKDVEPGAFLPDCFFGAFSHTRAVCSAVDQKLQMIARVSELEAKVAKRDFQIAHLKAALDRKDATLAAAGVDPHSATNSFRDTAAAGSAAAHA
jgi:uncharacterized small protein (DUF1192 family)